ncbi:MAG: hypothetical protein R3E98_01265 [Gemmatimonadota bacterium]|nr:hypothetical protein [Gemmatimonadota bacterium]
MTPRAALLFTAGLLAAPPLAAQADKAVEAEYERVAQIADADSAGTAERVAAARLARYLRRFDDARYYLARAERMARSGGDRNQVLSENLWLHLATGAGIGVVQQVFAEEHAEHPMPPTVVAGWLNAFPELLVGGAWDTLVTRLRSDAEDEAYRCACYAQRAWMHRAAGRPDLARIYWDSLAATRREVPDGLTAFEEAEWRARVARDLARAGRVDEARNELARADAIEVTDLERIQVIRRRAQAWAELGEVDRAVADLAYLLSVPSEVTRASLRTRLTWAPIRDDPRFQALQKEPAG